MRNIDKIINIFNNWFCSQNAIWQTVIATSIWVALEMIFPRIDPNGFILLYVLTILSFVTQPMLAYAANASALKSEESQKMLQQQMVNSIHQLQSMETLVKSQIEIINKLNTLVEQLQDKVEDIEEELSEDNKN